MTENQFKIVCNKCGYEHCLVERCSPPYYDDGVYFYCPECGNKTEGTEGYE